MLENQSEEIPETGYVYQSPEHVSEHALSGPVLSIESSDEIEDYLDQVTAPLVGTLPRSKREAIRANVRQRLESMIAAHSELGETHEAAIQAAIQQSGDPTLISQRWVVETRTPASRQVQKQVSLLNHTLESQGSARASTLTALLLFGLPYLADVTSWAGNFWATEWAGNFWATESNNHVTYYRFFLFAVPLLAGLTTGLVARNRPVRGVLNALAILSIPAILIPGLCFGLSYANVILDTNSSLPWLPNPIPGFAGIVPWLLMGSLGAGIGHKLYTRTAKLRTRLGRHLRLKRLSGGGQAGTTAL